MGERLYYANPEFNSDSMLQKGRILVPRLVFALDVFWTGLRGRATNELLATNIKAEGTFSSHLSRNYPLATW